jgi:hypothetical protein
MAHANDPFDFLWRDDADDSSVFDAGHSAEWEALSSSGSFGPVPAELDAYFDADLTDTGCEMLYQQLGRRRDLTEELMRTQRAIDALRETPSCPDLSMQILRRVDRRRGLLSKPWFNRLVAGRVAVAAALLLVAGAVFTLHGMDRRMANLGRATPISQLASALPQDVARSPAAPERDGARAGEVGTGSARIRLLPIDLNAMAKESRAALLSQAVSTDPVARVALVEAGELDLLGDDIDRSGAAAIGFGHAAVVAASMPVEYASLHSLPIIRDAMPDPDLQMLTQEMPASDTFAIAPPPQPIEPVITEAAVQYMGHTVERCQFVTLLAGFGSVTAAGLPLDSLSADSSLRSGSSY